MQFACFLIYDTAFTGCPLLNSCLTGLNVLSFNKAPTRPFFWCVYDPALFRLYSRNGCLPHHGPASFSISPLGTTRKYAPVFVPPRKCLAFKGLTRAEGSFLYPPFWESLQQKRRDPIFRSSVGLVWWPGVTRLRGDCASRSFKQCRFSPWFPTANGHVPRLEPQVSPFSAPPKNYHRCFFPLWTSSQITPRAHLMTLTFRGLPSSPVGRRIQAAIPPHLDP